MKRELYKEIEEVFSKDTVLASNTSGYTSTSIALEMEYPKRFIVTHFWKPGHLIPIVEVVKGNRPTTKRLSLLKQST